MVKHFYTVITATASILTLALAKKQLRLEQDFTEEDDLIQTYIDAAQEDRELYINRKIKEQNLILEADAFAASITFERNYENDVIESVTYYPLGEDALVVLDPSQYKLRKSNVTECFDIVFLSMPETVKRDDAVIITVNQGFTLATCPKTIMQAIKLRLADFYERREDRDVGNSSAANALVRAFRKY